MFNTTHNRLNRRSAVAAFLVACAASLMPVTASADATFTWMKGPQTANEPGVYAGVASALQPGARYDPGTWTDPSGRLWLYGGYGEDSASALGYLGDLWVFDPLTNNWTFQGGPQVRNQNASHGTLGVAAPSNTPGTRWAPSTWTSVDGRLWLFGGYGYDDVGALGELNDLMVYDPGTGLWTWVAGSNAVNDPGVLGSGPTATPSAREYPYVWTDPSGNFWLYGGWGRKAVGFDYLSDLWTFSPATGQWSLISGSNVLIAPVHGTKGVADVANTPGSRGYGTAWVDLQGRFYLFGGYTGSPTGYTNDLWRFDPATGLWTWIHGSNLTAQAGVYGTLGVPTDTNQPGTRGFAHAWNDRSGQIWVFGGYGRDSVGAADKHLGDLWKYNTATNQWSWEKGSNLAEPAGVWGVLGTPDPANIPSARWGHGVWSDANGALWLFGGDGVTGGTHHNDLWRLDVTYTADTAVTLNASAAGIVLGQQVVYSGQITNNGPDLAHNVTAVLTIGGEPLEFNPGVAPAPGAAAVPGVVTINVPPLAPGASHDFSTTVTHTLPGTAVTSIQLSPAPGDPNPANDFASVSVTVTQGDGPDLVGGGSVTQSCRVTRSGTRCRIRTAAVVTNSGNQDAPNSSLRVFLSDDAVLDPTDQQLREVGVRKIKIGRSTTKRITTNLPVGFSAGGKFVIIVVDALGVIAEGNEFNNKTAFGPIP